MSLPDFFIIGAPKCGTTTLYDWLRQHPRVYAPDKEPCFFSQDVESTAHLPTHIPTVEAYQAIFHTDDPNVLAIGEATPKYLYSDNALEQIYSLRPDAKIIICLRDPVDLVISLHNQKFREGVEAEKNFLKAWRRTIGPTGEVICRDPIVRGRINYFYWGSFGTRLQKVYEIFRTEQVLVITLNQIRSDPGATYAAILRFIGVPHDGRAKFSASNVGYKIKNAALHRTVSHLERLSGPLLVRLRRLRGGRGLGLKQLINRYNTVEGNYALSISEKERSNIGQVFADDYRIAEALLQDNVTWKRDGSAHF